MAVAQFRTSLAATRSRSDGSDVVEQHRRWFLVAIALTTFAPWLLLPWLVAGGDDTVLTLERAAYALGPSHQVITFALYADVSLRPIMRSSARRFFYAPVALIVGCVAFYGLAPASITNLSLLGIAGWSTFHTSRQNIGVAAFVHAGTGARSLGRGQKRLMTIVGAGGVAGVAGYVVDLGDVGLAWLSVPARVVAIALTAGAALAALPLMWHRRTDTLGNVFFLQGIVFYLPALIMPSRAIVVLGMAHALQYFLFMAHVVFPPGPAAVGGASGATARLRWSHLARTAVVITVVGGLARFWFNRSGIDALLGLSVGLSIVHYTLDASIWRLRDPQRRAYMAERFPFLAH